MIPEFLAAIEPLDLSTDEITDALWFAQHLTSVQLPTRPSQGEEPRPAASGHPEASNASPGEDRRSAEDQQTTTQATRPGRAATVGVAALLSTVPDDCDPAVRLPGVPALPDPLALARALRPLRRTRRSIHSFGLDEEATAMRIAETGLLVPVMRPAPARWLDLALVVDNGPSMALWRDAATEFHALLELQGAFRDVRLWRLGGDSTSQYELRASHDSPAVSPQHLVDPTGRRLVILLTDCTADGWSDGGMRRLLELWAASMPVALTQTLPQRLWNRTAAEFRYVRLTADRPGLPNSQLKVSLHSPEAEPGSADLGVPIPVLELEARWLAPWANLVAGTADQGVAGMALFTGVGANDERSVGNVIRDQGGPRSPVDLVSQFLANASPTAARLAAYLSVVPLALPVMRLVQRSMLPESRSAHLAEVFLSGLLVRVSPEDGSKDPDLVQYEFRPGVRELLLQTMRRSEAIQVLEQVSGLISGRPVGAFDFRALIMAAGAHSQLPFATVSAQVLRRLGGPYTEIADELDQLADAAPLSADSGLTASVPEAEQPQSVTRLTGREDLLAELRARFMEGTQVQVLHGPAGIGKTEVAAAFTEAFGRDYSVRSWIPAGSASTIRAALAGLAEALGVPRSPNLARTAAQVLRTLHDGPPDQRCLLIFDGAPSAEAVTGLLPAGTRDILITCRDSPAPGIAAIRVPPLRQADSVALLLRHDGMSVTVAHQMAAELRDHPLALSLAAALCQETAWTGQQVLELLPNAPDPADRVAVLVLEWLAQNEPLHLAAAQQCAAFAPAPIPLDVAGGYGQQLASWGLARIDSSGLTVATSVRDLIVRKLTPAEMRQSQRLAWLALSEAHPDTRDERAALLPHLQHLASQLETGDFDHVIVAGMHSALAEGEAEGARELAVTLLNRPASPPDDATMASAIACAREAAWQLGGLHKAAVLNAGQLAALEADHGPEHPLSLTALDSAVMDQRLAGEFASTRHLTEHVLRIVKRAYGPGHELSLHWADQAAIDLRLSGAFDRARKLDQATLDKRRVALGAGDRDTLRSTANLARDLSGAGDHEGALGLLREARVGLEGMADIPREEIIAVGHACAVELRWDGARTEARELATDIVVDGQAVLGHHHLTTLIAASHLAQCLRLDGRPQGGLQLGSQTLDGFRAVLGHAHPYTLAVQASTAILYRAAGQFGQAAHLGASALHGLRGSLGDKHPFTLCCLAGQASQHAAEGDRSAAEALWAKALGGFRMLWGPEHPYTVLAAVNHAQDGDRPPHEFVIELCPIR